MRPPALLHRFPERVVARELPDLGDLPIDMVAAHSTMPFCISDPAQPDCPIVFANRAFCELTGYPLNEVVGRNCRFLQGKDTDSAAVGAIRAAVEDGRAVAVDILNYRRNGTSFWNALHVGPILGDSGEVRYFFATQWDVTNVRAARERAEFSRTVTREVRRRTSLVTALAMHLVRVVGRVFNIPSEAREISDRMLALTRGYDVSSDLDQTGLVPLQASIARVVEPLAQVRLLEKGDEDLVDANQVALLALALHDIAEGSRERGTALMPISVAVQRVRDHIILRWTEPSAERGPVRARTRPERILDELLRTAGGRIEVDQSDERLEVTVLLRDWSSDSID